MMNVVRRRLEPRHRPDHGHRLAKALLGRLAGSLLVAGVGVVLWAGPASAHAFLVSSDPAPGARLSTAPTAATLHFTEGVNLEHSKVTLTVLGRGRQLPLVLSGSGATVRASVPVSESGIYEVAWRASSSDDGHITQGSFAFAVGSITGSIPAPTTHAPAANAVLVAANWIFFAGLALAAGGLVTAARIDRSVTTRSPLIRGGLITAIGAALLVALDSLGRGTNAAPPRVTLLAFDAAFLLCGALFSTAFTRSRPWVPLAFATGSAIAWAGVGHGAARDGALGWAVAAVHLMAVAVWGGALVQLVLHVRRAARERQEIWPAARRYARLAAWTVGVLAASGLYLAFTILPSLDSLWSSTYGQLLLAKGSLLLLALGLALRSRRQGIGRRRRRVLRRFTPLESGVLASALVASSLLVEVGPPATGLSVASLLGAAPLVGQSVQEAGLAGSLTVGIAANAKEIQLQVYAGTVQEFGTSISARVLLAGRAQWQPVSLKGCGPGCATGLLSLPSGTSQLSMHTSAPGWTGGTLTMPLSWPPPPLDPELLTSLVDTMNAVPSLQVTEQVRSGRYRTAPKTFTFTGDQFMKSEVYAASESDEGTPSAKDIRALPNGQAGLSFDLGQGHLWATIWLDPAGRIVRERIINAGNEIDRQFSYGGAP